MAIYSLAHFNKGENVATVGIRFSHLKVFMEKTELVGALSGLARLLPIASEISQNVTGPTITGHIYTNYTCSEISTISWSLFRVNTFCKLHLLFK